MRLFWTLTVSDLLVSVTISSLGFFSDEWCFFFLTQKVILLLLVPLGS